MCGDVLLRRRRSRMNEQPQQKSSKRYYWACWCSGSCLHFCSVSARSNIGRNVGEYFLYPSLPLHVNSGTVSHVGHGRFLPNPFQSIIHSLNGTYFFIPSTRLYLHTILTVSVCLKPSSGYNHYKNVTT